MIKISILYYIMDNNGNILKMWALKNGSIFSTEVLKVFRDYLILNIIK